MIRPVGHAGINMIYSGHGVNPVNAIILASVLAGSATLALAQASYFPIRTKSSAEGVTAFESKWYGDSMERMNEPRLPDFAKDANAEVYRLMILPTWGNPIAVRIQRHGGMYSLSARRLDGQGGYNPGKLVESKNIELDPKDSKNLEALIRNLNFFHLSTDDRGVDGNDGDEWILEGVSHGKYHVVERWCAADYNPEKRGLVSFLAFSKFLIDKSKLSERPQNKGQKII